MHYIISLNAELPQRPFSSVNRDVFDDVLRSNLVQKKQYVKIVPQMYGKSDQQLMSHS